MTIRLGGMASSLDTESIIQSLLDARSTPITALEDKNEALDEKYAAWTEIDSAMSILQSNATLLTNFTTWSQMTLTSSDEDILNGSVTGTSVEEKTFNITVSNLAAAHQYNSDAQTSTTAELGLSGEFTVNGQVISVDTTDSLKTIMTKINNVNGDMTGAGVTASLIGNSLVLTSDETGTANTMTIADTTGTVLQSLGFFNVGNEVTAKNLNATINNVAVTSSSNTKVTTLVSGITFNFTGTGTTTVTTAHDTENVKTLIEDFITSYNDVMSYLEEQTAVSVSSTSNTVSNVGLLQGDSLASKIQTKCRSLLTSINKNPSQMDQDFNCLYKVGIWFKDENNEMSITDEEKLDDALENNFDEVMALFRSYGSNGEGQGVFRQFTSYMDQLTDSATGTITNRKTNINDQMAANELKLAKLKSQLADYEVDLWQHFAQMETSVSQINSASSYVFSALGISQE